MNKPLLASQFTSPPQPHENLSLLAEQIAVKAEFCSLPDRLHDIRETIPGRIVFTTSFGLEDQAIAHAIFTADLAIDVVTLDTGRLFPETYDVWAQTERLYGRRIRAFFPDRERIEAYVQDQSINGFRASVAARHACCHIRKVEPLGRALNGASGWVTGVRAEQSANRATMRYAALEVAQQLIKVNPLLDWTRARVEAYVRDVGIPYNKLHDRGFVSIGCAPCTRAVAPGEPERAGRWWWEQEDKKECGLHVSAAAATGGSEA